MRTIQYRRGGLPGALLMAATLALVGCASTGYQKADATADSLRDAAEALHDESRTLDVAVASLTDLVTEPAPDLAPQFKQFSRAVDRLQSAAKRADRSIEVMRERRTEYLTLWEQERAAMNYGIIRERSDTRYAAVSNQVDTVLQRYEEIQEVVRPMVIYLVDLRRALNADLTADGLASMRDIATNAEENARKVQQGLALITMELTQSSTRISPYMVVSESESPAVLPETGEGDHRRIR